VGTNDDAICHSQHPSPFASVKARLERSPQANRKLEENVRFYPKQVAIQALVTDKDGAEYMLHVADNEGASSSIFDFAKHRDIWPDIHYTHDLKITSQTLPSALREASLNPDDYDALVLDTQGSELLALKGAVPLFSGIQYIKTEAADFESYRGATTLAELKLFLGSHGFALVRIDAFAHHPNGGKYYDVLFKKSDKSGANCKHT
jgi:hypothetical protein